MQCLATRTAKIDRNGQQLLAGSNDVKELLGNILTMLKSNPGFNYRGTGKPFI